MSTEWSNNDNATWANSHIIQLYLILLVSIEASIKYKKTRFWLTILFSILFNVGFAVTTAALSTACDIFSNCEETSYYNLIYSLSSIFAFLTCTYWLNTDSSSYAMFYIRKTKVEPSRIPYLDLGVLILTVGGTAVSNMPYIIIELNRWDEEFDSDKLDSIQAIVSAIVFLYFDVYYTIAVLCKTRTKASKAKILYLLAPTASLSLMYLYGSITYIFKTESNFYVNSLWNLSYATYPIVVTQSIIAAGISAFFEGPKLSVLSDERQLQSP